MPAIEDRQITELFISHHDALLNFLNRRIQCPQNAQDLTQETFLRLLKQDNISHQENLSGYLFKIAERISIDFIRQQKRQDLFLTIDDELASNNASIEQLTIFRQECELLLKAISGMSKRTRTIFLLRKVDELSYSEIAKKLGISEKTVQRSLVDAMLYCHQMLGTNTTHA